MGPWEAVARRLHLRAAALGARRVGRPLFQFRRPRAKANGSLDPPLPPNRDAPGSALGRTNGSVGDFVCSVGCESVGAGGLLAAGGICTGGRFGLESGWLLARRLLRALLARHGASGRRERIVISRGVVPGRHRGGDVFQSLNQRSQWRRVAPRVWRQGFRRHLPLSLGNGDHSQNHDHRQRGQPQHQTLHGGDSREEARVGWMRQTPRLASGVGQGKGLVRQAGTRQPPPDLERRNYQKFWATQRAVGRGPREVRRSR